MPGSSPAILHLGTETGWRGGEAQALFLARGLAPLGRRSVVAAPPGSELLKRAASAGLETVPFAARGEWDVAAARRLARLAAEIPAPIVHAHTATRRVSRSWRGFSAAGRGWWPRDASPFRCGRRFSGG